MERDILFAPAAEGKRLAVLDFTHSAFAVTVTEAELADKTAEYVRASARARENPEAIRNALQQSAIGRVMMESAGTYLPGLTTYLLKLGTAGLSEESNPMDRRIVDSFAGLAIRLRTQDIAQMLAEGIATSTAAKPGRAVCMVNLGGGTAADSWNALLWLRSLGRNHENDLLRDRRISIAVLDVDSSGPGFGSRAVEALRGEGAPLEVLRIKFRHFVHDWRQVDVLAARLGELEAGEAACVISSEGALFEYGSKEEIVANVKTLHAGTAADAIVAGSVTRDYGSDRSAPGVGGVAVIQGVSKYSKSSPGRVAGRSRECWRGCSA